MKKYLWIALLAWGSGIASAGLVPTEESPVLLNNNTSEWPITDTTTIIGPSNPPNNQFHTSQPSGKEAFSRCYMDVCTYGKALNKRVISSSDQIDILDPSERPELSINMEATILWGDAENKRNSKIEWVNKPTTVIAICSKQNPSIIMNDYITQLDVHDYPGVETNNVMLYFLICHDYDKGPYNGATRFNYPKQEKKDW